MLKKNKVISKGLDVVIPVHNSAFWLSWCLEELFKYKPSNLNSIIVVNDKSSIDQKYKIDQIVSKYPEIVLLNNQNVKSGFGSSCNLGASVSNAYSILFLNTDCLVTDFAIDKLHKALEMDDSYVMACPVSNNSPNYTYPMLPGRNYLEMAKLISLATASSEEKFIKEACTIVGNCLLVKSNFFNMIGGFSDQWGIGYGEETDMQMKAITMGKKGIVNLSSYVYHFGGGTFNYYSGIEKQKKKNYELFLSKWGGEYKKLESTSSPIKHLSMLTDSINNFLKKTKKTKKLTFDLIFYLPCLDSTIGGIASTVSICNNLIRKGMNATCAVIGFNDKTILNNFHEPLLFHPLIYLNDYEFFKDFNIRTKVIFSTIHTSSETVQQYAYLRGSVPVQFIQGYEGYFENGRSYGAAKSSYLKTKNLVTVSNFLKKMVSRHIDKKQKIEVLPLNINLNIFFNSFSTARDIDLIIVLRGSDDKGQWLLMELIDRLIEKKISITILHSHQYDFIQNMYKEKINCINLPMTTYSISNLFRRANVFLDLSSHEGFGLMPLEAGLCGAKVLVSRSGGVSDYIDFIDGDYVEINANPELIVEKICKEKDIKKFQKKDNFKLIHSRYKNADEEWYFYIKKIQKQFKGYKYKNLKSIEPKEIFINNIILNEELWLLISRIYMRIKKYLPNWVITKLKKIKKWFFKDVGKHKK